MDAPAIEIDYARRFSLPFGLAPTVDAAYVGGLDVDTGYAFYLRHPAPPQWPPAVREVAGIPFADGSGKLALVPASTTGALGITPTRQTLTDAAIKLVGAEVPPAVANGFRWDGPAAKTGPFPLPAYDDGALVMRWRPATAVAPGGALTNGIVENFLADFLLATHATGGDGEAARDLLRAPVVGVVRFERYRHLVASGAALSVGASSATGAVVIRSRAGGATPPGGRPPVLGSCLVVFENVDRASAVSCIGRLAWAALMRRGDVRAIVALKGEAALVLRLLVQAYLDYLVLVRPSHRRNQTDPLPLLAPALRAPFEGATPRPRPAQIEAVIDLCITDTTLRASLLDFVTTVFAQLVTGATWSEIDATAMASAPPAALKDAHARLKALPSSTDTWLPCYAGAPVGRAAPVVAEFLVEPPASTAAQESLSPFHLEALDAAGQSAPTTEAFGSLAALRIIDDAGVDTLLTTRDLLDAIVKGSNTATNFPAPLDLTGLAALGHPYAAAVDWTRFAHASAAVGLIETLRTHKTPRGPFLDAANIDFWKDRTGLVNGGNWPEIRPGVGAAVSPPTPAAPYVSAATRPVPFASGFDAHDFDAVLRARSVVRDGRSGTTDIPVPLFLALLDRESYRALGAMSRTAAHIDNPNIGTGGAPTAADLRAFTVTNWLVFPFGLDLLVRGTPVDGLGASLTGFPLRSGSVTPLFATSFPSIHARLVSLGILAADLEPLLNETDCLDYLELRRPGRLLAPRGISMMLRSRSAQWMAIALQMATFQWIHKQLSIATGTRHLTTTTTDEWVRANEYVVDPPPAPGATANSDERRRFIAYWSLVYVGFNTSPPTWNCWVNSVPDAKIAAGEPVSRFLTDRKNTVNTAVEPGPHDGPEKRLIGQRGHMVRFAAGLDAYMRLGVDADGADISDPHDRAWPLP